MAQPLTVTRIVLRPVAHLRAYSRNARKHPEHQIRKIADSIRRFGFNVPIVIDQDGMVLAGHARLAAAKLLGMHEVPTICVSLTVTDRRAYILADNRLAEKAEWDWEILSGELQALSGNLQLEGCGFSIEEIELVSTKAERPKVGPRTPTARRQPKARSRVSRCGDVWALGAHRLTVGESRPAECDRLIEEFQRMTGVDAYLTSTGETFTDLAVKGRERTEAPVLAE